MCGRLWVHVGVLTVDGEDAYVLFHPKICNILTDKWSFFTEFANFEVKIITGQNCLFKRQNCLFTPLLNEDVVASKNWWTEVTFAGQKWLLLDRSDNFFLELTELSFSAKLLVRSVVFPYFFISCAVEVGRWRVSNFFVL